MTVRLDDQDRALLAGDRGEAARTAMQLLLRLANIAGAPHFIDITSAHIDSCLYHGRAGLDFALRLADGGARVRVRTTLNVSSLDLLHPEHYRGDAETAARAKRLMDAYVGMGCQPTWTCAPYQLAQRPARGEHIAWAESNAIVFANSVLGALTDRYGDFTDICAAITGRVPFAGLHRPENRRGDVVFRMTGVSDRLLDEDALYPVLGHLLGRLHDGKVPVIDGLPPTVDEDRMKAIGAGAASAGAVALFHITGVTPEAPALDDALGGRSPARVIDVTPALLRGARDELTTRSDGALMAVSLGTPHFSLAEFERLLPLVANARFADGVDVWVNTARHVLDAVNAKGWLDTFRDAGVRIVTDTCNYITPILRRTNGVVMTNSAKWAYYAPGNLGVDVAFGTLEECVYSAMTGRIVRDDGLWRD
jgi:predicted aconitase